MIDEEREEKKTKERRSGSNIEEHCQDLKKEPGMLCDDV